MKLKGRLFLCAFMLALAVGSLPTAPVAQATTSPSACNDKVAKTLYTRRSFTVGNKKLSTASVAVYRVNGNKTDYCIVAYAWSGSRINYVEIVQRARATTKSSWKYVSSKDYAKNSTYLEYSTSQSSKLRGVSYGFGVRDSDGTQYYAFTPILTRR